MKKVTIEKPRENQIAKGNKEKKDKLDKEIKNLIKGSALKSEYDSDPIKSLLAAILEELIKLNKGA